MILLELLFNIAVLFLLTLAVSYLYFWFRLKREERKSIAEAISKMWSKDNPALTKLDKMMEDAFPKKGRMHFDCPSIMLTGKKKRVKAEITPNLDKLILKADPDNTFVIEVAKIMQCSLKGEDFKIVPINNNETQFIKKQGFNEWIWDITPLKSGAHILNLSVSILKKVEDMPVYQDIPVFEWEVYVQINPSYAVKTFFSKNWQWVIGSIVGSGILWEILKLKLS